MMVERNRYLNHALQELSFRFRSGTPNVFEHFMGLKEGSTVKQFDSPPIELGIHALFWHRGLQDVPGGPIQDFIAPSYRLSTFQYDSRDATVSG